MVATCQVLVVLIIGPLFASQSYMTSIRCCFNVEAASHPLLIAGFIWPDVAFFIVYNIFMNNQIILYSIQSHLWETIVEPLLVARLTSDHQGPRSNVMLRAQGDEISLHLPRVVRGPARPIYVHKARPKDAFIHFNSGGKVRGWACHGVDSGWTLPHPAILMYLFGLNPAVHHTVPLSKAKRQYLLAFWLCTAV